MLHQASKVASPDAILGTSALTAEETVHKSYYAINYNHTLTAIRVKVSDSSPWELRIFQSVAEKFIY